MTGTKLQSRRAWALAARQHNVVSHQQLLDLGLTRHAIAHRVAKGRLHQLWPHAYAVGSPNVTREGRWMAAVLTCGRGAALSHHTAGELWQLRKETPGPIDVSIPLARAVQRPGIRIHRRRSVAPDEIAHRADIPVTSPTATLIDLAVLLPARPLEAAVNEACIRGLIDPEAIRHRLEAFPPRPGLAVLKQSLDRHGFVL